jgi:hypothetical protein
MLSLRQRSRNSCLSLIRILAFAPVYHGRDHVVEHGSTGYRRVLERRRGAGSDFLILRSTHRAPVYVIERSAGYDLPVQRYRVRGGWFLAASPWVWFPLKATPAMAAAKMIPASVNTVPVLVFPIANVAPVILGLGTVLPTERVKMTSL